MPRCAQRVLRLALALVLCLQASSALALCVQHAARDGFLRALLMDRCPGGMEAAMADDAGAPDPADTGHGVLAFCPACHGLPSIALPAPPTWPQPQQAVAVAQFFPVPSAWPPCPIGPPYASTGPPALS